jgi:hypothetical protein
VEFLKERFKAIKKEILNITKQDISDAYSKGNINELDYNLLREKIMRAGTLM